MPEITLEHVKEAALWAQKATKPVPIGQEARKYNQVQWDCGTSCCMWGAASLLSGNGPATQGPGQDWCGQSLLHSAAGALMKSGLSTPEQMIKLLSGADLRSADLSGANLSGADLSDADLRSADLSGANLSGANLSGADLRSADLSGANLSGADLSGADLRSADLSGVVIWFGNRKLMLP